jgi:hypothetical protein
MAWPDLAKPGWLETVQTLQLWSQIVGKTRLASSPMVNHWWQVTLYATPVGLSTSLIHAGERAFEVELDLASSMLRLRDARGRTPSFPLEPMSVAQFYRKYRELLRSIDVELKIHDRPNEVLEAIPFERDEKHSAYDAEWARRFAAALLPIDAVLKEFRGEFLGKSSPVHFFWGAFDLAVTRFSGRSAPPHPGGIPNCPDRVMREAYSHEVSSAGFWPGDARFPEAAFYSYAYPEPAGFADAKVRPAAARYDTTLREHVLPYAAVRSASDPRRELRAFLDSTYEAAAELGQWDRPSLERDARETE